MDNHHHHNADDAQQQLGEDVMEDRGMQVRRELEIAEFLARHCSPPRQSMAEVPSAGGMVMGDHHSTAIAMEHSAAALGCMGSGSVQLAPVTVATGSGPQVVVTTAAAMAASELLEQKLQVGEGVGFLKIKKQISKIDPTHPSRPSNSSNSFNNSNSSSNNKSF